jgi:uncharacterized protein (TIGR03435 family)
MFDRIGEPRVFCSAPAPARVGRFERLSFMPIGGEARLVTTRLFVFLLVTSVTAAGQSFEVAVIRPHEPGRELTMAPGGGRFYATITLKYMIQVAYDVAPYQISGGPDWLDKQLWDITAKAEGFAGEIPLEPLRPMLRELIRERFHLKLQAGKQDLPYLALVVDRKGSSLKPTTSGVEDFHLSRGPVLSWTKVTMRSFASWLEPWIQANRVVLDETGLPGEYDLQLSWGPQPVATPPGTAGTTAPLVEPDGPTIFTALREQLGLRLEPRRGPIDTFFVEHAEWPSEN